LISEILVLARVDADNASAEEVDLTALLNTLQKDAQLGSPEQNVRLEAEPQLNLKGWPTMIERAVDNLLRNAQRFNPVGQPIEMQALRQGDRIVVSVRDHGPGVEAEHLNQLGEPFYRAPGQTAAGHGLGLAIARRAAERHGGSLVLANHPQGGFIASLELPLVPGAVVQP
jgi:signal transduction histidine kinase